MKKFALPCPFCGWVPDLTDTADFIYPVGRLRDLVQATCGNCTASVTGEDFDEALAEWNRRPANNPLMDHNYAD